MTDEHQLHT